MKEVYILQSVFKTAALSEDKRRILQDPQLNFFSCRAAPLPKAVATLIFVKVGG